VKDLANKFRKIASDVMPTKMKNTIKYFGRTPKRMKAYSNKAKGKVVTKQDIVNGLKKIGIKKGDTIFVHSSLSAFGFVEGGPQAIIDALLETVGNNGNVCMPCFGPLSDGKTFDVRETPSNLGKVSDVFWRLPTAKRSLSPTHSVACIGKQATQITTGHLIDETPFTKNSPYFKAMELGGKVIVLGSPLTRSLTCNYIVEDFAGSNFPVKVYSKNPKNFIVIDQSGKKIPVKKKVHNLDIDPVRIDYQPELADWLETFLKKRDCLKKEKIGKATVMVYGIKCLIEALEDLLKQGKTIYADESAANKKGLH